MGNEIEEMEIAKVSSKGQIVIPQSIREKLKVEEGNMFAVVSCNGTLILKKMENPLKPEDLKTLKMVDEAWQDIEKGRYRRLAKDAFLRHLARW